MTDPVSTREESDGAEGGRRQHAPADVAPELHTVPNDPTSERDADAR
jgi:hypothetical protein